MRLKRVITVFFCVLIIGAVVWAAVYLWRLHSETVSSDVSVYFQDGTISITWNPSFPVDTCRVFRYDEEAEDYVSCGQYTNGIILEAGADKKEVRLRLQPVRYSKIFGQRIELPGFSRELTIEPIEQVELYRTVEENKTVTVNWQAQKGCVYEVYFWGSDGSMQLYTETGDQTITLDFENDFAVPDRDDPIKMAVRAVQRTEGLVSYSPMSESMVITRNDLLENDLALCWEQIEERRYVLSWQECHGQQYELQQWSEEEGRWVSRCVLDWDEEMTYQTDHLPSNAQVRFRVVSYDRTEERDREEFKAEPAEVTFHTGMSPLYCTIWPIAPLKITAEPQGGEILGEVPAGQALCVLEENGDSFQILYGECLGYIDSRFCMINLPEYLGDLCEYDITNSISSIFRVHEYILPEITGSVIAGYENVCLGNGDYLVPYLYPCSAKLYQAIVSAAADGYRLRIYDAFRPNEATRYLYDTVELLLDEPAILESEEDEEGEEDEDSEEDEEGEEDEDSEENEDSEEGRDGEEDGNGKDSGDGSEDEEGSEEGEDSGNRNEEGEDGGEGGDSREEREDGDDEAGQQSEIEETPENAQTEGAQEENREQGTETESEQSGDTAAETESGLDADPEQGAEPEQNAGTEGTESERGMDHEMDGEWETDGSGESDADREDEEFPEEEYDTYWDVMTDGGRYSLRSFLAPGISTHNRGIALDLELIDADTKENLPMQTAIHDLSWYSVTGQNNENADLLAYYMKGAGYNGLITEWWHFQDDDTRNQIGLQSYLSAGVSIEGWKKDDTGWKYRLGDGSFYQNITVTIEGKTRVFDAEGYCTDFYTITIASGVTAHSRPERYRISNNMIHPLPKGSDDRMPACGTRPA
ncbi:MAG: hypothetical protein NC254_11940 [bacterium]|nr:hypothetical protein [bacterium]